VPPTDRGAVTSRAALACDAGPVPADLLVLATAASAAGNGAPGETGARLDYRELQRLVTADVLDYGVYPDGIMGRMARRIDTELRSDWLLAVHAVRRSRRYGAMLAMSERVGIPLALLRRAGMHRCRLGVLFQSWSPRQERIVRSLGLFREIECIGVNASAVRDHFLALGAPPERIHLLDWAIDHRFFAPRAGGAGPPFALSLGERRTRDYASLFAAVSGLPIEVRVLPRGYDGARETRPAALRPAPANVSLWPRVTSRGLRDLYAAARFVIVPVRDVIYPAGLTSALEAMAMARAVIASRSRGLRDYLVDGETCLLYEPRDVASLRDAIRRLAGDPTLARRLGENGRSLIESRLNQSRYVAQLGELVRTWTARPDGATLAARPIR
jgi:glycosyltransferase involved in cell wall biosynthesis